MSRSLTIDFLRGFAIWLMLVLHVFLHVYDYTWAYDLDVLFQQPLIVIILIFLLVYLGGWAGLFLLISMAANAISFTRNLEKGKDLKDIWIKQLLSGVAVLVVAFLSESIFAYHGVLGESLGRGRWVWAPFYRGLFNFETLNAIGWAIIITSTLMYLLYQNNGHIKTRRNIGIIGILAFLVMVLTPIIDWLITTFVYPQWPDNQYHWPPDSVGEFFLRKFLVAINGDLEPMFPYLTTACIGLIIGILLAQERPPKDLPRNIIISALLMFVLGVVMILIGVPFDLGFARPTLPWYLFGLGGQVLVTGILLWIVEFRGNTGWFTRLSYYWRRYGIIALTIYTMQIWDFVPRYIMKWLFGWPVTRFSLEVDQTLIMLVIIIAFWDLTLWLWAKIDFKYSFEWIIVNTIAYLGGIRSGRMDLDKVLYQVEPMDFSHLDQPVNQEQTATEKKIHDTFSLPRNSTYLGMLALGILLYLGMLMVIY